MKGETLHRGPEIQGIALGMAGEAAIDLPVKMDREVSVGSRRAVGDRTGATKLEPRLRVARNPIRSNTSVTETRWRSRR